ncbi:chromate transporter [Metabacillus halosaccharovorans]|uniref:chromate transporter n=1 Tax=Metabacillus halosaccharovorans TaxID=930124 RepID=UPI001C1F43AC|nr:chromate transporter [Metabacillus halosaccharovorans]MBU7591602.1 chromate transporter [Metabacillus halosaccharovorans]
MKQLQIFLAFFRSGMLGYGGGPSAIPLVHKEVVQNYKWMNDDEFGDVLALANTLPGPINTKMAGYIGYRVSGILGLINATLSSILPTIILMIVLLTTISSLKDYPWVQGMTAAVVPVVGVMLATLTWDFFKKSQTSMGWIKSLIFIGGSFLFMEVLGLHPAILIVVVLTAAVLIKDKNPDEEGHIERGNAS